MPTSFFTGTIIETPTGDDATAELRTQWYNVCRQAYWYMDKIDLLDYYHAYNLESPELAAPYKQAIKEMGKFSPAHSYLLDFIEP